MLLCGQRQCRLFWALLAAAGTPLGCGVGLQPRRQQLIGSSSSLVGLISANGRDPVGTVDWRTGTPDSPRGWLEPRKARYGFRKPRDIPLEKLPTHVGTRAKCGVTYKVKSQSDKDAKCPVNCPYYAQNREDDRHCTFTCVEAESCPMYNPKKPIADKKRNICRSPMVQACHKYVLNDPTRIDHCAVCNSGYSLGSDGQCTYKFMYVILAVGLVLLVIVVALLVWIADMACRPISNRRGLNEGMAFRQRSLIHHGSDVCHHPRRPRDPDVAETQGSCLWPLSTNLCTTDVAGSGMLLHFNFQVAVILWALLVGVGWWLLAYFVDEDLMLLGTRDFGTPRDNCILIAWGYETQRRLMPTKIEFLWAVYLGSFVLAMLHGVRQLRLHQDLDVEHKTMKDFVAVCVGLPCLPGSRRVEDELKTALLEALPPMTGVPDDSGRPGPAQTLSPGFGAQQVRRRDGIVGVSVAWNFRDQQDDVSSALKSEVKREEAEANQGRNDEDEPNRQLPPMRKRLYDYELSWFGPEDDEEPDAKHNNMMDLINNMSTSRNAFVVFETQAERDSAVASARDQGGIAFADTRVSLEMPHCEAATVEWQNFDRTGHGTKAWRLLQGFGWVMVALLLWVVVFYLPYAWTVLSFNYDNGQQPGFAYSMTFTIVVAIGNIIMYEVCNRIAEHVGFRFKDDKEAAYMVFYTVACTFNILVDFFTTYYTAYIITLELGFRTYSGQRIDEIPVFPEAFETYAIQRSLAENTVAYAFPSTYLIPFLIEPFPTIFIPLWIGKLIVRTHKEIQGVDAEEWLITAPMEMSRYGDILLDMVLAILIFYFPGGYTTFLFLAMAGSHVFVYALDHWRVLRAVPTCVFASMTIDWWCQVMLAPCCGLILSCIVFKSKNQEGVPNWSGWETVFYCSFAFVAHVLVHVFFLIYIVPFFGMMPQADTMADVTYKDVACTCASSWFSTNPVHCLRSRKVYRHSPPCEYLVSGKEHLLKPNESIGCYFQCKREKTEWDEPERGQH